MLLNGKFPKNQKSTEPTPPQEVDSSAAMPLRPVPPPKLTALPPHSIQDDSPSEPAPSPARSDKQTQDRKQTHQPLPVSTQKPEPAYGESQADRPDKPVSTNLSSAVDAPSSAASPQKAIQRTQRFKAPQIQPAFKVKAALQAVALGILPMAAIGTTAYVAINRSVAGELGSTQQTQSVQAADALSRFMAERINDVQVMAKLPTLRNPKIRDITTPQEKQQILEQFKATYGIYSGLAVLDLNGNSVLQTAGDLLSNQSEQTYFQSVLANNRPAAALPQISEFSGTAEIRIAAPVQDGETGQVVAVIMARLPVSQFEALLKASSALEDYAVFDAAGKVFLAAQPQQLGQSIQTLFPNALEQQFSSWQQPQNLISPRLKNGITLLETITNPAATDQEHLLGLAKTARLDPQMQWGVVSSADAQTVVEAQRHRIMLLLFAALGTAAIVGTATVLSARGASRLISATLKTLQDDLDKLQQKQSRGAERSRLLSEIVNNMRQSLRQEDILNTTVSELRYALNTDRVIVYFFESDWCGTIVAESVALGWRKILGEKVNDPLREGLIERYRNGRVRAMNDIYTENLTHCHQEILEGFQITASVVAPIVQNEKLIGLLCAHQCSGPRYWHEEDIDLFSKLASQLGYVLDQAALIQKQTRNADRSRLLNEIVSAMRRSLKEEDILNTTVSELRYALNTDRIIVYRFDDDWNGTIIAESVGLGWRKILGEKVEDPFREGLIERYRNGRVRAMNDVHAENLAKCHQALLAGFQIRASIVAPILQNGQLIGLLCAHQCSGPRRWEEEDVDLFSKLSTQLGFALDQASLLNKQTRSADRSRLLNEIVASMRRSIKVEEILNITVSELRYALHTNRVIVYRFHDDWNGTIIAESVAAGWRKILGEVVTDPFREGLIERYRNGRVRAMNDIYGEGLTDCHKDILEGFQIRASIVAPIIQSKKLVGLLCAHQCSGARDWEEEEIDLFTQLAVQLGFALDQADLLEYTEKARQEARQEADAKTEEQRQQKEFLQQRALELLKEVEPAKKGDLTVRARVTADEVGTIADSYNTLIKSLRQIVEQVQTASKSVAETATDNEAAVGTLSQEAKYQMHSISEASQQIQAMVESIQGVAERAKSAETSVQIATQALLAGDEAMDRTVSGISTIRETVSTTAKKVKRLGEASQKISRVVSLINGFAAQTNLLALNAAVEASRAGEEGKGFKVVAEEVRSLAQQSAVATAEIAQLVEEIQTQTNEVVTAMEAGTEQVVTGTQLVETSRQQLSQISEISSQINQLVKEISQAAAIQTQTSTGVSLTMEKVAAIADQTSQQSDTVANAFSDLLQVAKALQVSVAQFKIKD